MYRRILVPVDGSQTASKALAAALQIADLKGGRVRIVHVFDDVWHRAGYAFDGRAPRAAREHAAGLLRDAAARCGAAGIEADTHLLEAPERRLGELVADEAKAWAADLVVVGTHGRRGIGRALLGSGAEEVIRLAPVPVLVVRDGDVPAQA